MIASDSLAWPDAVVLVALIAALVVMFWLETRS